MSKLFAGLVVIAGALAIGCTVSSSADASMSGPDGSVADTTLRTDALQSGDTTARDADGAVNGASDASVDARPNATDAAADAPAPLPQACDSLADAGTWENITPPSVSAQLPGPGGWTTQGGCPFGTNAIAVDPVHPGIVYLGTCNMGFWKSTDCGASWQHMNTGTNAALLDQGREWMLVVDPVDPQIIYTNTGYGSAAAGNGAWRSTNGGVDWASLWPPADATLDAAVGQDVVYVVRLDPTDHTHMLLSFHGTCNTANYTAACFAESHDSGSTWRIVNLHPDWHGGEAQTVWFLDSSNTWLWGSDLDGMWRTTDAGASWTQVSASIGGHNSTVAYRATDGTFYLALSSGLIRSPDDGVTWTNVLAIPFSDIIGNGTTLFASNGFPWGTPQQPYEPFFTAPETGGTQLMPLPSPMLANGGDLAYDAYHHILYSSNMDAGMWRVVIQ